MGGDKKETDNEGFAIGGRLNNNRQAYTAARHLASPASLGFNQSGLTEVISAELKKLRWDVAGLHPGRRECDNAT